MDGEATDRQMLTTGINDRNIEDYLGLIEGRIDDLIQVRNIKMDDCYRHYSFWRPFIVLFTVQ
jgi:hypothetical protein